MATTTDLIRCWCAQSDNPIDCPSDLEALPADSSAEFPPLFSSHSDPHPSSSPGLHPKPQYAQRARDSPHVDPPESRTGLKGGGKRSRADYRHTLVGKKFVVLTTNPDHRTAGAVIRHGRILSVDVYQDHAFVVEFVGDEGHYPKIDLRPPPWRREELEQLERRGHWKLEDDKKPVASRVQPSSKVDASRDPEASGSGDATAVAAPAVSAQPSAAELPLADNGAGCAIVSPGDLPAVIESIFQESLASAANLSTRVADSAPAYGRSTRPRGAPPNPDPAHSCGAARPTQLEARGPSSPSW